MTDLLEGDSRGKPLARKPIVGSQEIPNVAVFLKRTTIEFLQVIFSTREKGSFQYNSDDSLTDIQISDQHAVDLEAVHVRPAIVVVRGPLSSQNIGLGGNNFESKDVRTGKTTLNDILTGSVAISCLSREGTDAEQTAHLVFNSFKMFAQVLRQYGFFSIKAMSIGGESIIVQEGDNDDLYVVPVYITAQIQDRWVLNPEVEIKLRNLIIETITCP